MKDTQRSREMFAYDMKHRFDISSAYQVIQGNEVDAFFHSQGKTFYISPDTCFQAPHNKTFTFRRADHCVPDNATLVEESVIGVPPDTTNITTWRYFTQTPLVTSVTMVTVLDNCIPLRSSMQGSAPEGNTVTTTVLYTSYRAGINDLSVFDIPTNCDNFPVG
ncbi:hypothetical protein ScPMuIL_004091 [Solemya velum]